MNSFPFFLGKVFAASFNKNVDQIASGGSDETIMVWNLKPKLRAFKFLGHKVSLLFSKNKICNFLFIMFRI